MLTRRTVLQASLGGSLVAATAAVAMIAHDRLPGPPDDAGWRAITWPFPRDGWPPGRAWRRGTVEVYVRPKLGFCGNCETGVVSDDEVDRVTDVDLLDPRFAALEDGNSIRLGSFSGRARLYRYKLANGEQRHAEGIAVSQKCDLIVAVVTGNLADSREREAAYRFLESNSVQDWLKQQLEGR